MRKLILKGKYVLIIFCFILGCWVEYLICIFFILYMFLLTLFFSDS
jgi:hypothetical protein